MYTVYTGSLEQLLGEDVTNIDTVVYMRPNHQDVRYTRNKDAEQLFENVFGVRPTVFTDNMYHDCGDIVSEHGTMLVYVGERMIKMYGGDSIFMDVQGK